MKNEDNQCFKWCITRAMNPVEVHPERITKELIKQAQKLDWTGIEFPVAVSEHIISRFERNNNICINVFGYESFVYPLYVSKQTSENVVNLLIMSDDEKKHYCWTKNCNRLMVEKNRKFVALNALLL